MIRVIQILKEKGDNVWSIGPETSLHDALKIMSDRNVGALMVLEGKKLAGIISERDFSRKILSKGITNLNLPVKDIMTNEVICIKPDQDLNECMTLMTQKRVRHLPVLDEKEEVIGIISIGDVVKNIISEQDIYIQGMVNYIVSGNYG